MNSAKLTTWEAWEFDDGSISLSTPEGIESHCQDADGFRKVRLLHSIQAATYEEARSIYHLISERGQSPYL